MKKVGLLLLFLFAVIVVIDRVVMPGYVTHGEKSVVPDVTGMAYDDAARKLRADGFEPQRSFHPKYVVGVDSNQVLLQNPAAGMQVKPGRNIWLVLNRREQPIFPMPDLTGRPEFDVRNALARMDMTIEDVHVSPVGNPEEDGKVLSQSVPARAMVKSGSSVTLVVGRYEQEDDAMQKVIVPDVLGMSVEQAWRVILDAGLSKGKIRNESSAILVPNTVISQKPAVSSYAFPGQPVELTVVSPQ